MPNKNVEVISDTNYSITDRTHPVRKKRKLFGRIVALLLSLILALLLRYYIEFSNQKTQDSSNDDSKQKQVDLIDIL